MFCRNEFFKNACHPSRRREFLEKNEEAFVAFSFRRGPHRPTRQHSHRAQPGPWVPPPSLERGASCPSLAPHYTVYVKYELLTACARLYAG